MKLDIYPVRDYRSEASCYSGADSGAEVVEWYTDAIRLFREIGFSPIEIPSADWDGVSTANAASVVLRTVVDACAAYPDIAVDIVCRDEEEAQVYRQMYNFWFAATKEERL